MTHASELCFSSLNELVMQLFMVGIFRLLAQWLRQPLRDRNAIVERHDVVEVILQDAEMRQMLRDEHLRRIPDMQALAKKLGRKKAGLQDCYRCGRGHIYIYFSGEQDVRAFRLAVTNHVSPLHCTTPCVEICGSCHKCKEHK
jgi:hypothetical protein